MTPLLPSTGAPVRDHRNGVRNQSETLSAFIGMRTYLAAGACRLLHLPLKGGGRREAPGGGLSWCVDLIEIRSSPHKRERNAEKPPRMSLRSIRATFLARKARGESLVGRIDTAGERCADV